MKQAKPNIRDNTCDGQPPDADGVLEKVTYGSAVVVGPDGQSRRETVAIPKALEHALGRALESGALERPEPKKGKR